MRTCCATASTLLIAFAACALGDEIPRELRVGRAGHAFDHLGGLANQAEAAAASGATVIYATGLGSYGYAGLPHEKVLDSYGDSVRDYNQKAKAKGIELSIGYVCATSMVKLETFDKKWSDEFRAQFKTSPGKWRQQDVNGQPLASWYGGDYAPACMNNPDWRAYERYMVRQQLESGHDGIFFDNPTVHQQGCYCPHCMERFATFLEQEGKTAQLDPGENKTTESLRRFAAEHPQAFLRFRATIARDFLAHIRDFARTINPRALITCNNSLNSPNALYSQCRLYGYNIAELSKAEDFVVVEDMVAQPRTEASGQMFEYGPTYKQLHAISHGKPIVAVTLANGDYHTAPNLVRLAMAEAAANNASYLSWPTWPEDQRARMIAAIRPQADLLRQNEELLNGSSARADVRVFLPMRRWVETELCGASKIAAALSQANVQYDVVSEENFDVSRTGSRPAVLVVESEAVLTREESATIGKFSSSGGEYVIADHPEWFTHVRTVLTKPSVVLKAPATVRAAVRDQPNRTIVHLLNLNVQRLSSFEDKVTPATDVQLTVRVPFRSIRKVLLHTADAGASSGPFPYSTQPDGDETIVKLDISRLEINTIIVIEG